MTNYADINDVRNSPNVTTILKLADYANEEIQRIIEEASAEIDGKIGSQSSTDKRIRKLCKLMVWVEIGSGLPTARAEGEIRESLLGMTSQWKTEIREILNDYNYGVPNPVFTSP